MAGWCNTCRAARASPAPTCQLCGATLIEPPAAITRDIIDLRSELDGPHDLTSAPVIDDPVEMDLTELHRAGRQKLQSELTERAIPFTWAGDMLIVPQHADPIVRELLAHPRPTPPRDPVIDEVMRAVGAVGPTEPSTPAPMPRTLRACAAIADWLILTLLVFIPALVFLSPADAAGSRELSVAGRWLIALGPAVYFGACVARMSSTPGKWLFRGEVVTSSGNRCDVVTAAVRAIVPSSISIVQALLPNATLFDSPTGEWIGTIWFAAVYLPVLVDPQRRGLHDRLAGTLVMTIAPRRRLRVPEMSD